MLVLLCHATHAYTHHVTETCKGPWGPFGGIREIRQKWVFVRRAKPSTEFIAAELKFCTRAANKRTYSKWKRLEAVRLSAEEAYIAQWREGKLDATSAIMSAPDQLDGQKVPA